MTQFGQGRGRAAEDQFRSVRRRVPEEQFPPGMGITVAVAIGAALWVVLILCGFLVFAVF